MNVRVTFWKYTLLFVVSLVFKSCTQEYQIQESGLHFKRLSIAEEERYLLENDYVQFKVFLGEEAGAMEKRLLIQIPTNFSKGGIMEALSLIAEGEKGRFKTFPDLIEDEFKQLINWDCFFKKELCVFYLSIDKIFTPQEFALVQVSFNELHQQSTPKNLLKLAEEKLIHEYLSTQDAIFEQLTSGIHFRKLQTGSGDSIVFGSHVAIKYKGSFLDGKVFNNTFEEQGYFDFFVGQEMQVIKGIEQILLHMKFGDQCLVIIPSYLAFGNEGNSNGWIPPNTPILIDLLVENPQKISLNP